MVQKEGDCVVYSVWEHRDLTKDYCALSTHPACDLEHSEVSCHPCAEAKWREMEGALCEGVIPRSSSPTWCSFFGLVSPMAVQR